MSARDQDRLKVLHEVGKGRLTQKQGGEQLGATERWVRKLLAGISRRYRIDFRLTPARRSPIWRDKR